MLWIQVVLMFIFSVGNDWFAIKWHEARENRNPRDGVIWGIILGGIGWLSFIWVIDSTYWLVVPDLIGTAVGSYFGIKYHHMPLPFAHILSIIKKPEKKTKEETSHD